jgi:hypothetical protein
LTFGVSIKKTAAKVRFDRGHLICVYTWRLAAEPAVLFSTPPPVIFTIKNDYHYKIPLLYSAIKSYPASYVNPQNGDFFGIVNKYGKGQTGMGKLQDLKWLK